MWIVDGNPVHIDNNFLEQREKKLVFETNGDRFFVNTVNNYGALIFESISPNTLTVDYGDGNTANIDFALHTNGRYRAGWTWDNGENGMLPEDGRLDIHYYTDGNTNSREITFEFSSIETLTMFYNQYAYMQGNFSTEINYANRLETLYLAWTNYDNLPLVDSVAARLTDVTLTNSFSNIQTVIPDGFFEAPMVAFRVSSSVYDVSDPISSNLFKINQWAETLETLYLSNTNMINLIEEFRELVNLINVRLAGNTFTEIPKEIETWSNVEELFIGNEVLGALENNTYPDLSNLTKLERVSFQRFTNLNIQDFAAAFAPCVSLKALRNFNLWFQNDTQFNDFIDAIYDLVTSNAEFNGGYRPDLPFRHMNWGHSSFMVDSIVEEPTGFIADENNGFVDTRGKKLYVLSNNYRHTIQYSE